MMRFILVTFAFLAVAFYQMSGGADFDKEETRLARIDAPTEVTQQPLDTADVAWTNAPVPENVTRVALNLTTVDEADSRTDALRTIPAKATPKAEEVATTNGVSEEEPTIILPSLIVDRPVITRVDFGNDADTNTASGNFDVRAVTGNSVNVRGGPGTDFSVVNRLTRGDQVEILQDPGNGWVQMRPVGGGTAGWMADFLLSNG
ncbi:MAG: SH3 domain-containing protein [Tateyamaria sp.]|uniref:SH3 domain-containing protein n=1 Tax=Tateyamaria sp. TaxID=1929288 RepID=UPI00329D54E5